jgi:crotonobetaine/carnitine-CoA ligase
MRERNELILADLIAARANRQPDLDVVTFEHLSLDGGATADEVRTFADLQANANRLAAGLIAKGVRRGDRVAVMMRNHPEFVETLVACSISGAVFVPIDPRTRGEKLAYMLHHAGCAGLICADYCLAEVAAVRQQVPNVRWVMLLETQEDVPAGATMSGVAPLADWLRGPAPTVDVHAESPGTPLQIMYTSGTTGDPKGIVGSNFRFCAAGILGMLFGYRPDERPYTGLSLTHGNAQSVTLAPALSMGLRAVFSRRFTKSKLWEVCRTYGCTTFSLLGGMATAIYSEPPHAHDGEHAVHMVVSGGMPAAIWEAFERRFHVRVVEFYGAMDGGGMAYKPIGEGPVGSFGKPMPGIEMRILDAEGNECPAGVVGEICCRTAGGSDVRVEYFADPEASAKKMRGGWNRSGDMGHRDADGWLYFDYRAGGGLRHNGDFINPSFVEKAIAEHPDVTDVFVYGVPAASGAPGEKDVVAAIVPVAGRALDAAAIFAACRDHLEPNCVPTYLQVVGEIPKTVSEKPQERVLLDQFDPTAANVFSATRGLEKRRTP